MPDQSDRISQLLQKVSEGDGEAAREILPAVYRELRHLAGARMANLPPGQTLQPTELVHEAYLRVMGKAEVSWDGRSHFFFASARAMRDILVESARKKASKKHGGELERIELRDAGDILDPPTADMLVLDQILQKLEDEDPEGHQIAMLRYFAGMRVPETAELLNTSVSSVERKWRFTRAWLEREFERAMK